MDLQCAHKTSHTSARARVRAKSNLIFSRRAFIVRSGVRCVLPHRSAAAGCEAASIALAVDLYSISAMRARTQTPPYHICVDICAAIWQAKLQIEQGGWVQRIGALSDEWCTHGIALVLSKLVAVCFLNIMWGTTCKSVSVGAMP